MKFHRLLILVFLLGVVPAAFAGAWGYGAFENDDALDWVWELESSSNFSAVEAALKGVLTAGSYIEAHTASAAIAAAEVVAAASGSPNEYLPEEVTEWVSTRRGGVDDALVRLARQVIPRVLDTQQSDLAQLWAESPEDYVGWKAELADLLERLE